MAWCDATRKVPPHLLRFDPVEVDAWVDRARVPVRR